MKCLILFFGLTIQIYSEPNNQVLRRVPKINYEECTLLKGDYKLINTGEVWNLELVEDSDEEYFLFRCTENNCNEQIAFSWNDCDEREGIVRLCPKDGSGDGELTFSICKLITKCDGSEEKHFSKVIFNTRGKPNWIAEYYCSGN